MHPRHSPPPEHKNILVALNSAAPRPRVAGSRQMILSGLKLAFSVLYDTFWIVLIKIRFFHDITKSQRERKNLLIKTWVPNPNNIGSHDFYYGEFRSKAEKKEIKTLLLGGDARPDDGPWTVKLRQGLQWMKFAATMFRNPELGYFPEICLIPPWAPVFIFFKQILSAFKTRKKARAERDTDTALFLHHLAIDILRPYTNRNVCHFYIAQKAMRVWKPAFYLTLFEGQPWEKLVWLAIKSENNNCTIMGYQHAAITTNSISILNPQFKSWEVSVPDIILCSGKEVARLLESRLRKFDSKVIPLGSFKIRPTPKPHCTPRAELKTILVIPEGIPDETIQLFDYTLELAPLMPEFKFVLRCHPVLPFEKVMGQLKRKTDEVPNVVISRSNTLDADLEQSSVVFYRGSVTVFQAIKKGCLPIYISFHNHELNMDPLFELNVWRKKSNSLNETRAILNNFIGQGTSTKESWEKAKEYVETLMTPVSPDSLEDLLIRLSAKNKAMD